MATNFHIVVGTDYLDISCVQLVSIIFMKSRYIKVSEHLYMKEFDILKCVVVNLLVITKSA